MDQKTWTRFWSKVDADPGGCWQWTAGTYSNGYGCFHIAGKPRRTALAHRWLYERLIGPVPDGLDLDHLCRNRGCVNPAHLEPVTRSENLKRSPGLMGRHNSEKTHCKRGHPLEGDNVRITSQGSRQCQECKRQQKREQRARIKANPDRRDAYLAQGAAHARAYRKRQRGGREAAPNSDKTHCPQGHPYTGDNVYRDANGARRCRTCVRAANRRAYLRRKERQPST